MNQAFSASSQCFGIAATSVASTSVSLPNPGNTIRIVNEGPNTAYVSIGPGTQVATVPTATPVGTCTPILAGSDIALGIPTVTGLQISAICAAGTAALDIQVGNGV